MNKHEFLEKLDGLLQGINQNEKTKTLLYYDELISDKMDDGLSEEDAVKSCGDVSKIASELLTELPLATLIQGKVKQSHKQSNNKTLWVVLAICGFPIWLPLAISFAVVIISVYASVWAVIISLFAVEVSLILCGILALLFGIWNLITQQSAFGFALISIGIVCIGLFILSIKPMLWLLKQFVKLTALFMKKVKGLFINKKGAR